MLRHARGRYTELQIERCSKMGGGFGKEIDRLFDQDICNMETTYQQSRSKSLSYQRDIVKFVDEFRQDALFDYFPPRQHYGFLNYVDTSAKINRPVELAKRLNALSDDYDFWRQQASNSD